MMETETTGFDLYDEYFGDDQFDTVTIDDIGDVSMSTSGSTPNDWTFVRARAMTRDCMLYSEGIYRILSTKRDRPLADRLVQRGCDEYVADGRIRAPSTDAVLDAMPRTERQRMAVPSVRGEYVSLKEVKGYENDDGTIRVDTTAGFSDTVPVEFVIDVLSYDEVVCEFVDESLSA